MMIIAHRGASGRAPENTLAAFRRAWEDEADGIEGDFQLSADGHIVCIHDPATKRVAGTDLVVAESCLKDLQKLDVGSWKGTAWAGEQIPTLPEILSIVPSGKRLYIEIKGGVEMVAPLTELLQSAPLTPELTVIISFDQEIIARCKVAMPERKAFWLVQLRLQEQTRQIVPEPDEVVQTLKRIHADGASVDTVTPELASALQRAGKELHVWTVDDPDDVPRLLGLGVASIITNRPAALRQRKRGQAL